ncbi:MAG TPA: DUF421 domain-containing protein [Thermomicrobiales bacterium]|nr:DUF421 domain-containing protein [Thermomicrobiales bacterium]HRA32874.1 DUF421 domain-containing protein [Thermomicrobiales bacterium]
MFQLDPRALGEILVRTTAVYAVLLALLRLAGKRELGQMSVFDLVVVLIVANAVQNAMVGPDTSLNGGLLAAGWLIALNWGVGRLGLRYDWLGKRISGSPTMLVWEGKPLLDHLRREGVAMGELEMAAREHGVEKVGDVKLAILESDGTISIVTRDIPVRHTRHRVRGRKPRG